MPVDSAGAALVAPLATGPVTPTRTFAPTLAQPTAPTGLGEQPSAVLPQDAKPQRAVSKAAPTHTPQAGDLICGECGEGNAATRRFCSRCGGSLAIAERVRIPWWRKLFPKRGRRAAGKSGDPKATAKHGAAKKRNRKLPALVRSVRGVMAVVFLLGGIAYASVPAVRTEVNDKANAAIGKVQSIVHPQYAPAHPVDARASAAVKDHPAGNTIDGFTNTFWAAPTNTPEQVLILGFDHPVEVRKALIRVGVSGAFTSTARPHAVHVVYSSAKSQDLNLDDKADAQEVSLDPGSPVTSIELHITSFYRAVGSNDVAITEIELFVKK
jgi:hypothetical protein